MTTNRSFRLCAALRSRDHVLDGYRITRPFRRRVVAATGDILIPRWLTRIHNQWHRPFCVGYGIASQLEGQVGDDPPISGLGIAREAHRLQGRIESISSGTRVEYGIDAVQSRGWDEYEPNEEDYDAEAGKGAPPAGDDILSELQAHDNRRRITEHLYLVRPGDVDDALAEGLGVVIATGTRSGFVDLKPDDVATEKHLGGGDGGHCMVIIGRIGGRYLLRNSWGSDWGGANVDGQLRGGLFWASPAVIKHCWERHTFRIGQKRG